MKNLTVVACFMGVAVLWLWALLMPLPLEAQQQAMRRGAVSAGTDTIWTGKQTFNSATIPPVVVGTLGVLLVAPAESTFGLNRQWLGCDKPYAANEGANIVLGGAYNGGNSTDQVGYGVIAGVKENGVIGDWGGNLVLGITKNGVGAGPLEALRVRSDQTIAVKAAFVFSSSTTTPTGAQLGTGGGAIWVSNAVVYASFSANGSTVTTKQLAP